MALEYNVLKLRLESEAYNSPVDALAAKTAEGWRVHTAFAPDHYLLERGTSPVARDQPATPPTGTKG